MYDRSGSDRTVSHRSGSDRTVSDRTVSGGSGVDRSGSGGSGSARSVSRAPAPDGEGGDELIIGEPVDRSFFARDVEEVGPALLGRLLTHRTAEGSVTVRLTEVEAYAGPRDAASHAYRGRTPRNDVMFGPPGHVYVYFTYGMHFCMNLVCAEEGTASAVLLRAGEVVDGLDLARTRRPRSSVRDLARGPARLCQALGVDRALNGADICSAGPIRVFVGRPPAAESIRSGPRTGVNGAKDVPWRFWLDGEPSVSPYRPHVPRGPRRTSSHDAV